MEQLVPQRRENQLSRAVVNNYLKSKFIDQVFFSWKIAALEVKHEWKK